MLFRSPHRSRPQHLESFNSVADYNSYLTYILCVPLNPPEEDTVRSMAGLLLKNNVRLRLEEMPQDVVSYIKATIFNAIGDPVSMIRNTVSTVIDTLIVELGPTNWPEALSRLMELVDSPDQYTQEVSALAGPNTRGTSSPGSHRSWSAMEATLPWADAESLPQGAFTTLDKLCQDIPKKLELMDVGGARPLDYMIPKFLAHIDSPYAKIRAHALSCTNQFISADVNALTIHLERYASALFKHASEIGRAHV